MPVYLNVETIRQAAELVNDALITKGHTSEDLKFITTDWEELIKDQPEQDALATLAVEETIYNNDKNDIDRHNRQHEAANQVLAEKDATIAKLERKLATAESDATSYQKKLTRAVKIDSPALTSQIEELNKKSRAQLREIQRIRNLNTELQNKYEVEKRRMVTEISELRSSNLHSRGLSTTISYGRPLNLGKNGASGPRDPEVNSQLVHYNKASINNSEAPDLSSRSEDASPIVKREYDRIALQLSELIERLMNENSKFAKLTRELTTYMEKVNANIAPEKVREESGPALVNPAEVIDLQRINADTNDEVVPFELTSTPLLASIYNNYDRLSTLVDMAVANTWELGTSGGRENDRVAVLEGENSSLRRNWQDALKALDELRKHRKKA